MSVFKIKIADHVVEIETLHVRSQSICLPFSTTDLPEFNICIGQSDIDQKRKQIETALGDCTLWDGSVETIVLQEKLAKKLIDFDVFLMHGAAVAYNGNAYIFTAPSGTGKTTHIIKWLKNLVGSFVVNGDKPFVCLTPSPAVYGSPWAGKENLYKNTKVPLKSIILMERAENNSMERISFAEAFPVLLQQVYLTDEEDKMRKVLRLMQKLTNDVSFWRFKCNNFKDDCFDVAFGALTGKPDGCTGQY